MAQEPIKSALSFGEIGETSLALPSDGNALTAERRVLEQVNTMRKKSKRYGNKGSSTGTLSPTSPKSVKSDSVFYDHKFPSANLNGSEFVYEGTLANGSAQMRKQSVMQRSVSTRAGNFNRMSNSMMLPNSLPVLSQTNFQAELGGAQGGVMSSTTNRASKYRQTKKIVRSFSQPQSSNLGQIVANSSLFGTSNQILRGSTVSKRPPSAHSNPEPKPSVAVRSMTEINGMNGEGNVYDVKLSDAIAWINTPDERYQLNGASVIQHTTYTDDKAKDEVRKLNGIGPLVSLIKNSNPQLQLTAASALRNLVFKNSANKKEVLQKGGLDGALDLLQDSRLPEDIQKHVTGLLWNLSSEGSIQEALIDQGLSVLTSTVLEPNAEISGTGPDSSYESYCNATACIRNLSSGKQSNRRKLRNSVGLIDSLVKHMESAVDNGYLTNKSVENCVCVLHNLTYQLEIEEPSLFKAINAHATSLESRASTTDSGPIGCFSNQSRKYQQETSSTYMPLEDSHPIGKNRLIHSETMSLYLKLLKSQNQCTQEACCGVLHNLTAKKGCVSDVMSNIIVQKLGGVKDISEFVTSPDLSLRNSVMTLMGNLSRNPQLHSICVRQGLPDLLKSLQYEHGPESDNAVTVACHTVHNLMRSEPEAVKIFIQPPLITALRNLSENPSMPKSSQAAGVLLHSLWAEKTVQGSLKKRGMHKSMFVNDATTSAFKSLQISE